MAKRHQRGYFPASEPRGPKLLAAARRALAEGRTNAARVACIDFKLETVRQPSTEHMFKECRKISSAAYTQAVKDKGWRGVGGVGGLPKASAALLRRLRYEGGEFCGSGKHPAGSAVLVRRGLVRVQHGATWCLTVVKKRRRK